MAAKNKKNKKLEKIREMERKELEEKIRELRTELAKVRAEVAAGKEKDYSKVGRLRKEIARHMTVLREKEGI